MVSFLCDPRANYILCDHTNSSRKELPISHSFSHALHGIVRACSLNMSPLSGL